MNAQTAKARRPRPDRAWLGDAVRWTRAAGLVQAAAVVAVVLFGAGVAMSENGSSMRRGLGILFGLSIAFAASTFFLQFFGFAGGAEIA